MYLYGAGGHAKVIMDILKENSTELTGIIDDNPHIQEWMEYHVLSYDPKRMFYFPSDLPNHYFFH